ncbi:hypothetical protein [Streptomyces sp. NPDC008121]|uniref:hypothetical protein n=1 Tax=Streptomyces sp. NPDC008121 TaxID=3364809 RepID=UPI0036E51336
MSSLRRRSVLFAVGATIVVSGIVPGAAYASEVRGGDAPVSAQTTCAYSCSYRIQNTSQHALKLISSEDASFAEGKGPDAEIKRGWTDFVTVNYLNPDPNRQPVISYQDTVNGTMYSVFLQDFVNGKSKMKITRSDGSVEFREAAYNVYPDTIYFDLYE